MACAIDDTLSNMFEDLESERQTSVEFSGQLLPHSFISSKVCGERSKNLAWQGFTKAVQKLEKY